MRRLAIYPLICLFALTTVFSLDHPASADDTSALINQALDKQVKLSLNDVLPAALDTIAKQTGVRVEADPIVYDLLPWGRDTNINAKIENQTLREALDAITRKLGLMFRLRDQEIEILPMPPLRRLGRRSTIEELGALDKLASTPLNLPSNRPTIKELIDAVDKGLEASKSPYAVEDRSGDAVKQTDVVSVARNGTMMDGLESLARETNATWYPWGKTILIVSKQRQVRRELNRIISLRYDGVDIAQVLTDMQKRSGVRFDIEPGAIQQVPPESRSVHLRIDNGTMQDALEALSSVTGLAYNVKDNGIYIWNQSTTASHDPVIAIIPLPDSGIQVLVKESQVPADMREYLRSRTQKELDKLRELMKEEGFKPTTQAAMHPTTSESPKDKEALN